jgi:hypothetical protein
LIGRMPRLLDMASRTFHEVVGALELIPAKHTLDNEGVIFYDVGSVGVRYFHSGYHTNYDGVLDWHTGVAMLDVEDRADQVVDLDRAALFAPLCKTLGRTPTNYAADGPTYFPFHYEQPYGLAENDDRRTLTLQRCGHVRGLVLSRQAVRDVQLGAAVATWVAPAGNVPKVNAFAYLQTCGARLEWRGGRWLRAAHVRDAVVLSEAPSEQGPWTLRRIPFAGACHRVNRAWIVGFGGEPYAVPVSARRATLRLPSKGAWATHLHTVGWTASRFALHGQTELPLRFGTPIRSVRWRLGGGPWHTAVTGATWTLSIPHLTQSRMLDFAVRFPQGGAASFRVRLDPSPPRR